MNRISKSTALLASVLFATLSVQAGVPFNNLEGVGGAAFNPLAYTAGQNAGTNNPNAILSKPQAGAWFTRLGDKNINWEAFGVAETIGKRFELSYGYEAIRLGGENAKNISKNNIGAKVLAIQENEFGSFVPAVSVGAIWKNTDANLFGQHNSGLDSYLVATKLITQTPVPVLVSAGLLYTAEEVTGAVGFNKDHDLTYFGNIDVIPVSCLAVGAEYKQGARFANGFKNANYWDTHVAFFAGPNLTLIDAYVYTGSETSVSRVGLGDGFVLSAQYAF